VRGLLRLVALVAYLLGGVLIGSTIGRLVLIPIAAVAHVSHTWQTGLGVAGGLLGAFSALGWWRAKFGGFRPAGGGVHGSAHFASERQVKDSLGGAAGLIVGRENRRGGQLLRYAGQAHLLTIAPTRSGKGVGAIIPNLLTADRSVLCIDPKGENAHITARARAKFGPVYVLDPFDISGQPSATFNPLAGLDPDSLDLAEDAALLADALVHDPPGQVGEAHWNEEAKALIAGVILYVVCEEHTEVRTLATVRELMTLSPGLLRRYAGPE
jgi:type IV secretion system protein VirD4